MTLGNTPDESEPSTPGAGGGPEEVGAGLGHAEPARQHRAAGQLGEQPAERRDAEKVGGAEEAGARELAGLGVREGLALLDEDPRLGRAVLFGALQAAAAPLAQPPPQPAARRLRRLRPSLPHREGVALEARLARRERHFHQLVVRQSIERGAVEDVAGAREVVEAGRTLDPLLNKGGLGCFDEDRPVALDVYLDINPGMNRTGCPLDRALATARSIREAVGERFSGLHMYDGHAGGLLKEHAGDRRKLDAALFPLYDKLLEIDGALGATCTSVDSQLCTNFAGFSTSGVPRRSRSSGQSASLANKFKYVLGSILLAASVMMFLGILFTNRRRRRAMMHRKFRQAAARKKRSGSRSKSRSGHRSRSRGGRESSRARSKSKSRSQSKSRSDRDDNGTGGVLT